MACLKKFCSFEPTDLPKWRKRLPSDEEKPTISQMIDDIVGYKRRYVTAKAEGKITEEIKKETNFKFLLKFLFNVQSEEDIGIPSKGTTQDVVQILENNYDEAESRGINDLVETVTSQMEKEHTISSQQSSESSSSHESDCEPQSKRAKPDPFEPPNCPSFGDTEAEIEFQHTAISQKEKPPKTFYETVNLYRAYKHLAREINDIKKRERHLYLGMIDVETCILKTHSILMDGIDGNTKPGIFSTNERVAYFKGIKHIYPKFTTSDLAETAVQTLVDKYTDILEEIRKIPDDPENEREKIAKSFKCGSIFLFGFLTLHPFGDGNGRLARLLCCYSLFTFSPFLTPIFNVFSSSVTDDYIEALVEAEKGLELPEVITTKEEALKAAVAILDQKPCDLCALIIESNRDMWQNYLTDLNIM